MVCGYHYIPYKFFTKLTTIALVQDMVTCLNMIPLKNGISSDLSPESIILGSSNPDHNRLKITFGSYAHV